MNRMRLSDSPENNNDPLSLAINSQGFSSVVDLLESGKSPSVENLIEAINVNNPEILKTLLEKIDPVNLNELPLRHAIFKHNSDLVSIILKSDFIPTSTFGDLIVIAAKLKEPEIVRLLINKFPNLCSQENIQKILQIAEEGGDYATWFILLSQNKITTSINQMEKFISKCTDLVLEEFNSQKRDPNFQLKVRVLENYLNEKKEIIEDYKSSVNTSQANNSTENQATDRKIHETFQIWSDFFEEAQKNQEKLENSTVTPKGMEFMNEWKKTMNQRLQTIEETFKQGLSSSLQERTINAQILKLDTSLKLIDDSLQKLSGIRQKTQAQ